MAVIAGKVAITPKGEWNVDTQYEKLDFVLYGSDSYVARKTSVGVEPGTDDETWQLSLRGASSKDIQNLYNAINNIIDGTATVGNSEKVGGASLTDIQGWTSAELNNYLPNTGGTIQGQLVANSSAVSNLGNKQMRNIYAGTTEMVAGTTTLNAGDIYVQLKV